MRRSTVVRAAHNFRLPEVAQLLKDAEAASIASSGSDDDAQSTPTASSRTTVSENNDNIATIPEFSPWMLGFPPGDQVAVFSKEEFCGACGVLHKRPDLLDMYNACHNCHCVLRQPQNLRNRYQGIKPEHPIEILFATYGDPYDPEKVFIVTDQVKQRVHDVAPVFHDRLAFRPVHALDELFALPYDPNPGENKQLRVRYRVKHDLIHATLVLDVLPNHCLPQTFVLMIPKQRFLRIFSAIYGHPKGATSTGRMSIDVTEVLQSLADMNGGSYMTISAFTPLTRLFGDPCPGYPKDLRLQYEVRGRRGYVSYSEIRGFPRKRIFISQSPTVTPIIFVTSATYGITPTGRRDRLAAFEKQLYKITQLEHKKREGLALTPAEVKIFRKKKTLVEQREMFKNLPTKFIDVSVKLQMVADKGGIRLFLDKESFDPNELFGNPCPGTAKILECNLDCRGHDSERLTESNEMTDTGFARNFITTKANRFNIVVEDDPVTGKGRLSESLDFGSDTASPVLVITRATYGELDNIEKVIDVTFDLQNLVKDRSLTIEKDVNLNTLFKVDPSPGKRKQLKIAYITRGFTGNLRVREKNDCLVASVELGYPPVPPPDDEAGFEQG